MTHQLCVIIPSRGRPEAAAELWQAWQDTADGVATLHFCLDADDVTAPSYPRWQEGLSTSCWARNGFAPRLSSEAVDRAPHYFALASWGDDHRPLTKGWDTALVNALADLGSGFAYGDDVLQGEALPTACAMTSDVVSALGYMTPPGFAHLYVDNVWLELGRAMGRITYLPHVVIAHQHPVTGAVAWDELARQANTPQAYDADRKAFELWRKHQMPLAVEKLRARSWAYVEQHLTDAGFEPVTVDAGGEPFSRAASRNLGAAPGLADVVILHDADMLAPADAYDAMADRALETGRLVVGFSEYRALSKWTTRSAIKGLVDPWQVEPAAVLRDFSVGGIVAITPAAWAEVGGQDPAFVAWGCEDFAFAHACSVVLGPIERLATPALHLWHPIAQQHDQVEQNTELMHAYLDTTTVEELRAVQRKAKELCR